MKKLALSVLLAVILHAAAAAQNQSEVEVIKFSWSKLDHNTIPSGKQVQEMRNAQRDAQISEENRKPEHEQDYGEIIRLQREKQTQMTPLDRPDPTNKKYEYKVRFKNRSTKEIISLEWIYVFRDATTKEELGEVIFINDIKIKPDKEKEFIAYRNFSPPKTIIAAAQEKKPKTWVEEVIIAKVVYADGSIWERK